MRIFLGASAVMAVLAVSGICMSMIAKLNRNLQRYGIEMMNGQSTGDHPGGVSPGNGSGDRGRAPSDGLAVHDSDPELYGILPGYVGSGRFFGGGGISGLHPEAAGRGH